MLSDRSKRSIWVAMAATLTAASVYLLGSIGTPSAWLTAVGCIAVVAVAWREAARLLKQELAGAPDIVLGLAIGMAGMFVILAAQLEYEAEQARACSEPTP